MSSQGNGAVRAVTIGGHSREVNFADVIGAIRFDRVLRVRQDSARYGRPRGDNRRRTATPAGPATHAARGGTSYSRDAATWAELYRRYAANAMLASALLLGLAWLDLAGGAIVTIILWLRGAILSGFLVLFAAAAGCAVPLCLGCLTRAVIYRHRAQDAT